MDIVGRSPNVTVTTSGACRRNQISPIELIQAQVRFLLDSS